MLGNSYYAEANRENNEVPYKLDERYKPFEVSVYGDVLVREFETHVRISKDDWNKYKQRLIPVLKQGDTKDGNTEAGNEEENSSPASRQSDDIGSSHW